MYERPAGWLVALGLEDPSASEFIAHPDHRQVSAFFLGWVFYCSLNYLLRSPLAIRVGRRIRYSTVSQPLRAGTTDQQPRQLESNVVTDTEAKVAEWVKATTRSASSEERDPKNLVFALTFTFTLASLAQFTTLLVFPARGGDTACTFLVAWGGLAAQSTRLLGLLKLSFDLQTLGCHRWETVVFWGTLIVSLILMFITNAVSIGTLRPVPNVLNIVLCYRKHFLLTAVFSSVLNLLLEFYVIGRLLFFLMPSDAPIRSMLEAALDPRLGRAGSFLLMELCTIIPSMMPVSIAADFIPFSVTSIIVLVAFNYHAPSPRRGAVVLNFPVGQARTSEGPDVELGPIRQSANAPTLPPVPVQPSITGFGRPTHNRPPHPFSAEAFKDLSSQKDDWPEPPTAHSSRSMDSAVAASVKNAVVSVAFRQPGGPHDHRSVLPPLPSAPEGVWLSSSRHPVPSVPELPSGTPGLRKIVPSQTQYAQMLEETKAAQLSVTPNPGPQPPRPSRGGGPAISVVIAGDPNRPATYQTPITPSTPNSTWFGSDIVQHHSRAKDAMRRHSITTDGDSYRESPESVSKRLSGFSFRHSIGDDLPVLYEGSQSSSPEEAEKSGLAKRPTFGQQTFRGSVSGRPPSWKQDLPQTPKEEKELEGFLSPGRALVDKAAIPVAGPSSLRRPRTLGSNDRKAPAGSRRAGGMSREQLYEEESRRRRRSDAETLPRSSMKRPAI